MSGLRISEVQAHERPRERLFALGASSLTLVELVAILVGTGLSGADAMEVGEAVLAVGGGSLRSLARRPAAELARVRGFEPRPLHGLTTFQ